MAAVAKKKKSNRSLFYRISAWLHLWLGLITGIIVIIVCLTGCIWCFNEEITSILEPETRVAKQEKPVLPPSRLMAIAASELKDYRVTNYSVYQGKVFEVYAQPLNVKSNAGNARLYIDPYTGQVIKKRIYEKGEVPFFRWILNGHRFLWFPWKLGRPIVNYSILIFVITLITGIVLWWPRKWTKATREQAFKVKWTASLKRVNYDLHNVFGFYSLLILLVISLTGMVWGIEWFSKGTYWLTTGGQTLPPYSTVSSDTTRPGKGYLPEQAADIVWNKVVSAHPGATGFYMSLPDTAERKSSFFVSVYPKRGVFYNFKRYTFDQYNVKELKPEKEGVYDMSYETASVGTKLRRLNYDIHVGAILGLPGKFLAFFASLIGASLPITGFIIWWGKKKKKKGGKHQRKTVLSQHKTHASA
ncbi:PepSY-associated TM helix domain-containing protein [Filimonas effusa]|uniref:PepSY domain-containing protein n=1 Tax=Filimonas effusa TaxID=2508721 RepID=A0A4Q1D8Q3_9BACT|nr:PepSY-associated TM helix domain-containing protein [Filimonas effusa]RXK85712.1 PepSY domain-containing protein [Filimonas effusa]